MSITIVQDKKEVRTYNIYAKCSDCGTEMIKNDPFIVWDNNGTPGDLSDDTFEYSYKCPDCNETILSKVQYPHQEFEEI